MPVISIDTDELREKWESVQDEVGDLLEKATQVGLVPEKIAAFLPLAGPAANILAKLASKKGGSAVSGFGKIPDTGPLGLGCAKLLRKADYFGDEQFCGAFASMASAMRKNGAAPMAERITDSVNFTLELMFPDMKDHTAEQTRKAIERVITRGALEDGTAQKLGDVLYFCLTAKQEDTPEQDKEEEK